MKTRFSKNWNEISNQAMTIKDNIPNNISLHEYLKSIMMRDMMLSRTSADEILARLENGVTFFYTQNSLSSSSSSIDFDSLIETVSGYLTIEDKREFLLNMLFVEQLRMAVIPETISLVDTCQDLKKKLNDEYGISDSEISRLKNDVLNGISCIVDSEMNLDQAVEYINSFKEDDKVIKEANILMSSKEDSLIYAVASYIFFSSQSNIEDDSDLAPEVIGTGAAFTLAALDAMKNRRSRLISKETLHKVLRSLYKVFFACILAFGAYFLISGIAALSIYVVAMCFTLGTFWGLISLILAAHIVTSSLESMLSVGQQLWEWGENGYETIRGFFSNLIDKIRVLFSSAHVEQNNTFQPTIAPQIMPNPEIALS